jgi:hypothetical protein
MKRLLGEASGEFDATARGTGNLVNMNEIVGVHDILFICLDTLRYDVAKAEEERNGTPVLNRYGPWEKRHAPGNFTYPSHCAMFAGFLPRPADPVLARQGEKLFFPKERIGIKGKAPVTAFVFEGATFIEGLEKVGYQTYCVGGVSFFDKRSAMGRVLPKLFQYSYWHPSFACPVKASFDHQIEFIKRKLAGVSKAQRVFMYLNVDAIHYPNYFYGEDATADSKATHAAALRYVDQRLEALFDIFRSRGRTFVIACSDHGTCYGEDGYYSHGIAHEITYTVPYKHFFI